MLGGATYPELRANINHQVEEHAAKTISPSAPPSEQKK